MSRDFRKILAWQKSDALTCEIYHVTRSFPPEELYGGLGSELRARSVGAAALIAEGSNSHGQEAFVLALQEAQLELTAVDYYLSLALRLGYLEQQLHDRLQELRAEAAGMLYAFMLSVEKNAREERRPQELSLG